MYDMCVNTDFTSIDISFLHLFVLNNSHTYYNLDRANTASICSSSKDNLCSTSTVCWPTAGTDAKSVSMYYCDVERGTFL